jgi:hypothetical protein
MPGHKDKGAMSEREDTLKPAMEMGPMQGTHMQILEIKLLLKIKEIERFIKKLVTEIEIESLSLMRTTKNA